jgi:serine/threonine protein kinase/Tfp pilus assembly protein PilF
MPDKSPINELLLRWEELREQGQTLSAEELCVDCPDLAPELARKIAALQAVYGVLDMAGPAAEAAEPASAAGTPSFARTAKFSAVVPGRTHTAAPGADQAPAPPPVVPGYEVLEEVGRGGMGVVYKARQLKLNRPVALKMLLAGAHSGKEQVARFRAEAETVARLQHPNIVHIYEVGEHQGRPFCALEFVQGGSLDQRLAGEPLPARQAAALTQILARAMEVAHRAGIIHRDLKPGNVLLVGGREVPLDRCLPKVTDFGLAKQLNDDSWKTRSGAIMGTPSYMAPEQAGAGAEGTGAWTDVYALGAMLYEFLTGRPPFRASSVMDTLDQIRYQEPVPPSRLQPKVPRDLETICLKCLQKEPRKRHASAQAFADDLERFLQNKPILARPTGSVERLIKWARRRPAAAALIAVSSVALATLVAIAFLLARSQNQSLQLQLAQEREHQEQADRERLDSIRNQVLRLIRGASQHIIRKTAWEQAQQDLTRAQGLVDLEPVALAALANEIGPLAKQVQMALETEKEDRRRRQEQEKAHIVYTQFQEDRDRSLLHSSMAVGQDRARHLAEAKSSALQALARFNVHAADMSKPHFPAGLEKADQDKVLGACYELLLVLADSVAAPAAGQQPDPAQTAHALAILRHAGSLIGENTKIFHLRKARYLEMAGNRRGSDAARQMANGFAPRRALDYYLVGEEEYKRGHLDAASGNFQHALFREPDYFWARYLLAVCYVRQGLWLQARDALTACCKDKSGFVWPYLLLGFVNTQLNDFAEAEAAFIEAKRRTTGEAEAVYALYANRGLLRISQKRVEEGIADLRLAINRRPGQYQGHLSLAIIYERQQNWNGAREEFDQAITWAPAIVSLYRARAGFRERRGELEAALEDRQAVRRDGLAPPDPEERAADHVACGHILQRLKRHKDAVAAFGEALRLFADLPEAYLGHGVSLLQLASGVVDRNAVPLYEAASRDFDEYLVRRQSASADAYRGRAVARSALGRYVAAAEDYSAAARLDARRAAALLTGGVALAGSSPLVALTDVAAGLETERGRAAMHLARGVVFLAYQSPLMARPEFEEALRIDHANREARLGLGFALAKLGHPEQGVAEAERALRAGRPTAEQYVSASRVFAQAAAEVRVRMDGSHRDRLPVERRRHYHEHARVLLEKAKAIAPLAEFKQLWQKRVETDSAFDPLRGDPRFLQLVPYRRAPATRTAE